MIRAYYGNPAEQFQPQLIEFAVNMQKRIFVSLCILAVLSLSGCVYRQAISQGNLITEENLEQVEVGMTRNQIRFLLGTPMIDDPFHTDRWDYVYYIKIGRGDAQRKRWLSVFFADGVVTEVRRDQALAPEL